MSKAKYTCGVALPSGCILFTGDLPTFIPTGSVDCDANIDDIFAKHADKIEQLIAATDLTAINKGCYTTNTFLVKDFIQETADKVCDLETKVANLQTAVNNLNIGSLLVNIDLKCLKPLASPCAVSADTYTLVSILNTILNEICLIKSTLNL